MSGFVSGDIVRLKRNHIVKHGDTIFYEVKSGTLLRVQRRPAYSSPDFVCVYKHTRKISWGDSFSVPHDYLKKLSPLELLALQAPDA